MRRYSKYLYFAIFLVLIFALFPLSASAEGEEAYTVTANGEEYALVYDGEELIRAKTLAELLPLAVEGSVLFFDEIHTDAPIYLSRSYTLRGELTVTGGALLTVAEGASVTFDEGTLSFSDEGYVRVKDGTFTLSGGEIYAGEGSGIVMDYSSSARFFMTDGALCASTASAALSLSLGTAVISGGVIENTAGFAITSSASLYLSGSPTLRGATYDLFAKAPPSLTYGDESFLSTLSVMYDGTFSHGEGYCLFYLATEDQASRITLSDRYGTEYALSYFAEASFCEEERFLAVALPYTARFVLFGKEYHSTLVYRGDTVSAPPVPESLGYTFLGWYTDAACRDAYDFKAPVGEELTLYAKMSLVSPTFSLSSLTFTYDGEVHPLALSSLDHPLSSSGYFSYEWYRDGELLEDSSAALPIKNVGQSGEYHLRVSFTYGNDAVTVTTPTVSVEVYPATVASPLIDCKNYTGAPLTAEIYDNGIYWVTENFGGTDVGRYPVVITLTDPENYRFDGTDESTLTLFFEITRAKNAWVTYPTVKDIYEGRAPSPVAYARFGALTVLYGTERDGAFTERPPTAVGEYLVRLSVGESTNYEGLDAVYLSFSILPVYATGIRVATPPHKTAYVAFEPFVTDGLTVYVSYCDGTVASVSADALGIEYLTHESSLAFGDTSVGLVFEGVRTSVAVTVERAVYALDGFTFSDTTHVYDGSAGSIAPEGSLPVGLDGIRPTYTVTGGGVGVGEYTVVLTFFTESTQYVLPEPRSATLTVLPREVTLVWVGETFIYDGTRHAPTASFTDVFGNTVIPTVSGGAVTAGDAYIAAAEATANYLYQNPTCQFRIGRATYDLSGVFWKTPDLVYNGEEKSVLIEGLPSGVVCLGYADNTGRDVGTYTAYVTLGYDEVNYYPPRIDPFVFEITPAEFDMSDVHFPDMSFTYDGTVHTPLLYGTLPTGIDGSTLTVSFDRGVLHVAEGEVAVTVTFTPTSKNYKAPPPMTVLLSVVPCPVEVVWQVSDFVYNGELHTPVATAPECAVRVTGGAVNAGEYTAVATAGDPDYTVTNATVTFTVRKAQNAFLLPLTVESVYESGVVSPTASVLVGKIGYHYYLDEALTQPIDRPVSVGTYYVVARVPELENYLPLTSAPLAFSVLPVLPTGISVELGAGPFYAHSTLPCTAYTAYLLYNDGSRTPIDALTVAYMHADTLLAKDTSVRFTYGAFSEDVAITVRRMPVTVELPSLIYTGERQYAAPPVSPYYTVLSDEGGIHAGEYTLTLRLLDPENDCFLGVEGDLLEVTYRIARRPITVTFDDQRIYLDDKTVNVSYRITEGTLAGEDMLSVSPLITASRIGGIVTHPDYEITVIEGQILGGNRLSPEGKEVLLLCLMLLFLIVLLLIILFLRRRELVRAVRRYRRRRRARRALASLVPVTKALRCEPKALVPPPLIETPPVVPEDTEPEEIEELGEAEEIEEIEQTEEAEEVEETEEIEETEQTEELTASAPEHEELLRIYTDRADELITDTLAKDLIREERITVTTRGTRRAIINVDTLSRGFLPSERVDVNILKERNLIPYDTGYLKVLARGFIDKPLRVYANDFSLAAVKMIALTGGEAVKVKTNAEKNARQMRKKRNHT